MAIAEQFEGVLERVFGQWLSEPAPPYAFEFSEAGLAWASRAGGAVAMESGFEPLAAGTLAISPVKDNVLQPDELDRAVRAVAAKAGAAPGKRTLPAALILPDYSTRVSVLEFESFPTDRTEQLSLVRFRMKKTVPFDLDDAAISFSARSISGLTKDGMPKKGTEVVAAAAPVEVIARYEAPLRAAGFAPGLVTSSALASMDLLDGLGLVMSAKLAGSVLTVSVSEGTRLKLLRCVELESNSADRVALDEVMLEEIMNVLGPTLVFAEDEFPSRPQVLMACGFGQHLGELQAAAMAELSLDVRPLASPWGAPDDTNAGLRGYWAANGKN